MGKVRLRKCVLPKEKLASMSDCERGVFVYSGHISNEINWLTKVMYFLQKSGRSIADKLPGEISDEERAIHEGHTAQILIALKLLAGKNHEAILFIKKWCFEMPWFEQLSQNFTVEGNEAIQGIKNYLLNLELDPKSSLLKLVRDKSAFHYDDAAVKASMKVNSRVEEFTIYHGDNVGNTLYIGSEYAIADFLIEKSVKGAANETLEALMEDALSTSKENFTCA